MTEFFKNAVRILAVILFILGSLTAGLFIGQAFVYAGERAEGEFLDSFGTAVYFPILGAFAVLALATGAAYNYFNRS